MPTARASDKGHTQLEHNSQRMRAAVDHFNPRRARLGTRDGEG